MEPHQFPRRLLVAVAGLHPQVVTETLYALVVQNSGAPFIPTEIRLLTTREGAERAELGLLDPHKGYFPAFCRDFGLPPETIHFTRECIHVLPDAAGAPLADIRSEADNGAAADHITELVRAWTADPGTALHGSLAGGRKTLGLYLGFALSLFGRPQDRLSHVLVSEPFESEPQFFYPPPKPEVLFLSRARNRPVRTDQACVTLADIPFVRLRAGLPEALRDGQRSYSQVVHTLEAAVGPVHLAIDLERRRIRCGGAVLALPPQPLALLAWMARRRLEGEGPIPWRDSDGSGFLAAYAEIEDALSHNLDKARQALARAGPDEREDFFRQKRSRLNSAIQEGLGDWGEPYKIQALGERPHTAYGLTLDPERITFAPVAEEIEG